MNIHSFNEGFILKCAEYNVNPCFVKCALSLDDIQRALHLMGQYGHSAFNSLQDLAKNFDYTNWGKRFGEGLGRLEDLGEGLNKDINSLNNIYRQRSDQLRQLYQTDPKKTLQELFASA